MTPEPLHRLAARVATSVKRSVPYTLFAILVAAGLASGQQFQFKQLPRYEQQVL